MEKSYAIRHEETEDGMLLEYDALLTLIRLQRRKHEHMRLYAVQLPNTHVWRIRAKCKGIPDFKTIVDLPYDSLQEEVTQVLLACARLGMDDGEG